MRHVLGRVAERERSTRVERRAVPVFELDVVRIVDRAPVEHGAQHRVPADEAHAIAARELQPPRVEQPGRGVELVDDPLPGFVAELDDRLGGLVARRDVDPARTRNVGVRVAVRQSEGQRADVSRPLRRQRTVARTKTPWQIDPVELVEVEIGEAGHALPSRPGL